MSDIKLNLEPRTLVGKKLKSLRESGMIPSVIYGEKEPILTSSSYVETEKALKNAGYHSPIDLILNKKTQMAIVKSIAIDPVSRKILNVEFEAISADEVVEATAPIVIVDFEKSEASKLHFAILQVMEEIEVKAKPSNLPKELVVDASKLDKADSKLVLSDIILPKGVEIADKELSLDQVIANVYDPAAESAAREAENAKESVDAADVPSDNGKKPDEKAE